MTGKQEQIFPTHVKYINAIFTFFIFGGVLFFGSKLSNSILITAMIVVFANVCIYISIEKSQNTKHYISLVFLVALGFLSLVFLVYKDFIVYKDVNGGLIKAVLFYVYFVSINYIFNKAGWLNK